MRVVRCFVPCRAQKLIAGLDGEKSRWTAAAERLGQEYVQLTGNVLLAAAQVAYLGAFTSTYRTECLRQWVRMCAAKGVPCSEKFKLAAVLADPVKVCWRPAHTRHRGCWLLQTGCRACVGGPVHAMRNCLARAETCARTAGPRSVSGTSGACLKMTRQPRMPSPLTRVRELQHQHSLSYKVALHNSSSTAHSTDPAAPHWRA